MTSKISDNIKSTFQIANSLLLPFQLKRLNFCFILFKINCLNKLMFKIIKLQNEKKKWFNILDCRM